MTCHGGGGFIGFGLMTRAASICVTLILIALRLPAGAAPEDLRLTLPPVVYAVPGLPMSIYYDNIVLTEHPEAYQFEVDCPIGSQEASRWTLTATAADEGDHPLRIRIHSQTGAELERGEITVRVVPRDAGADKSVRLLLVGDSLTAATIYPNELGRLLSSPGNPRWSMIGSSRPATTGPGVVHEGYGGWTWEAFLTRYGPPPEKVTAGTLARRTRSPFLFPADGDKGNLDLPRYFEEHGEGQPPQVVTFLLGINDCFGADPESPDRAIDAALDRAEVLLRAFHEAAPRTLLAVGLTTPPNARESGFVANYQGKYHRWGWKRIQHRLVERMLERLGGREDEGIYLVPTELNLDPWAGYPENNGVHPNAIGYAQIAASFYAWIKGHL